MNQSTSQCKECPMASIVHDISLIIYLQQIRLMEKMARNKLVIGILMTALGLALLVMGIAGFIEYLNCVIY